MRTPPTEGVSPREQGAALRDLIRARTHTDARARSWADDPEVTRLVDAIHQRHGSNVCAVLLYGSYLRGKRDTLLDFYVLLDDLRGGFPRRWHSVANVVLPPNVYHVGSNGPADELRAKYATLRLDQFERANARNFHGYFWARFTQPCAMVFVRDAATADRVVNAIGQAVGTFVSRVTPMLDAQFTAAEFWNVGFRLTYGAELRAERPGSVATLYESDPEGFARLLDAHARDVRSELRAVPELVETYRHESKGRRRAGIAWAVRRWQGKVLSILRLVKAAGTFDDPLDYVLWKVERHSGIREQATERQRRLPLIFGWSVIWRLYRRGAFR